jgi:hypothetical protein
MFSVPRELPRHGCALDGGNMPRQQALYLIFAFIKQHVLTD